MLCCSRPQERKTVEECTKSIVNKLLHGCMAALRCDGSDPEVCFPAATSPLPCSLHLVLGSLGVSPGSSK